MAIPETDTGYSWRYIAGEATEVEAIEVAIEVDAHGDTRAGHRGMPGGIEQARLWK